MHKRPNLTSRKLPSIFHQNFKTKRCRSSAAGNFRLAKPCRSSAAGNFRLAKACRSGAAGNFQLAKACRSGAANFLPQNQGFGLGSLPLRMVDA